VRAYLAYEDDFANSPQLSFFVRRLELITFRRIIRDVCGIFSDFGEVKGKDTAHPINLIHYIIDFVTSEQRPSGATFRPLKRSASSILCFHKV